MDEKKTLDALNRAVEQLVPDLCESLLETPVQKDEKIDEFTIQRNVWMMWFPRAMVMVAGLFLCFFVGRTFNKENFAEISIDVNPGIEMLVNEDNQIMSSWATNEEGQKILEQISIGHKDMQQGVDMIIEKMYQNSYLKKGEENFALISVCVGKEMKQDIGEQLEAQVKKSIKKANVNCEVITQRLQKTSHVDKTAKKYHLTQGKAALIERIIAQEGNHYTKEQLAKMKVKELLKLIKENNMQQTDEELDIETIESTESKPEHVEKKPEDQLQDIQNIPINPEGSDLENVEDSGSVPEGDNSTNEQGDDVNGSVSGSGDQTGETEEQTGETGDGTGEENRGTVDETEEETGGTVDETEDGTGETGTGEETGGTGDGTGGMGETGDGTGDGSEDGTGDGTEDGTGDGANGTGGEGTNGTGGEGTGTGTGEGTEGNGSGSGTNGGGGNGNRDGSNGTRENRNRTRDGTEVKRINKMI